jgi:hypothetical protein
MHGQILSTKDASFEIGKYPDNLALSGSSAGNSQAKGGPKIASMACRAVSSFVGDEVTSRW